MEETTIATLSQEEVLAIAKRERKAKKRVADRNAAFKGKHNAQVRINVRSWAMHGWREVEELESMPDVSQ